MKLQLAATTLKLSHFRPYFTSSYAMSLRLVCRARRGGERLLLSQSSQTLPTLQPSAALATATATKVTMDEYWMPFTHNRSFKQKPKMLHRAEGPFYYLEVGR